MREMGEKGEKDEETDGGEEYCWLIIAGKWVGGTVEYSIRGGTFPERAAGE